MKKKEISRSVDEIREKILHFFYDKHKNASTPSRVRLKISEARKGLKEIGISSKEAISNIEYLIDGGWINKEIERKEFTTKTGVSVPSDTAYYKASNKTIDHFDEGKSIFRKNELNGINITNIQGVTTLTVGDSNDVVVNTEFVGLHAHLDKLINGIKLSSELEDEDKLNYVAEIKTIKAQLMKPLPDKGIIKTAWEKLGKIATVSGLITFFQQIEPLIKSLL